MNPLRLFLLCNYVILRKSKEDTARAKTKEYCQYVVKKVEPKDLHFAKNAYKQIVKKYMDEITSYLRIYKETKGKIHKDSSVRIPKTLFTDEAKTKCEQFFSVYEHHFKFKKLKDNKKYQKEKRLERIKLYKSHFLLSVPIKARKEVAEMICRRFENYTACFVEEGFFTTAGEVFVIDGVCTLNPPTLSHDNQINVQTIQEKKQEEVLTCEEESNSCKANIVYQEDVNKNQSLPVAFEVKEEPELLTGSISLLQTQPSEHEILEEVSNRDIQRTDDRIHIHENIQLTSAEIHELITADDSDEDGMDFSRKSPIIERDWDCASTLTQEIIRMKNEDLKSRFEKFLALKKERVFYVLPGQKHTRKFDKHDLHRNGETCFGFSFLLNTFVRPKETVSGHKYTKHLKEEDTPFDIVFLDSQNSPKVLTVNDYKPFFASEFNFNIISQVPDSVECHKRIRTNDYSRGAVEKLILLLKEMHASLSINSEVPSEELDFSLYIYVTMRLPRGNYEESDSDTCKKKQTIVVDGNLYLSSPSNTNSFAAYFISFGLKGSFSQVDAVIKQKKHIITEATMLVKNENVSVFKELKSYLEELVKDGETCTMVEPRGLNSDPITPDEFLCKVPTVVEISIYEE